MKPEAWIAKYYIQSPHATISRGSRPNQNSSLQCRMRLLERVDLSPYEDRVRQHDHATAFLFSPFDSQERSMVGPGSGFQEYTTQVARWMNVHSPDLTMVHDTQGYKSGFIDICLYDDSGVLIYVYRLHGCIYHHLHTCNVIVSAHFKAATSARVNNVTGLLTTKEGRAFRLDRLDEHHDPARVFTHQQRRALVCLKVIKGTPSPQGPRDWSEAGPETLLINGRPMGHHHHHAVEAGVTSAQYVRCLQAWKYAETATHSFRQLTFLLIENEALHVASLPPASRCGPTPDTSVVIAADCLDPAQPN
jgi:hypothetical protein